LKADPSAQAKLLDVQQLDSRIDALRHQRANLPELAELAGVAPKHKQLDDRLRDRKIQISDLTDEQKKADRDVETVKARRERDRKMLDSGEVRDPKAAERMLHELESLERRISDLEDVEIEVMERLEATQQDADVTERELAELAERVGTLEHSRDLKQADLDKEIASVGAERDTEAGTLPEDLLALYAKLREQKGGVGAAELRAKQCDGCHLTLDAAILRDIAATPADDVVRCEECGRILVRTAESGL
jgi:predicted  nucleic acid-binding Zn-ribbon protein